jgi:hypothetical protein
MFEEQMFYMKIRYRMRVIALFVAAICGGIALDNYWAMGAFIALAFTEMFRD